jgi:hypothetical protein
VSNIQDFIPQRHEIGESEAAPGMGSLDDHEYALADLEKEIHLDASPRRAMAAGLIALGWRETSHLAEHLAWLLQRETDALTAYSLYRAVVVTHPDRGALTSWTHSVLQTTPFALLRTAILDDLLAQGYIDVDSAEDQALLALLDKTNPEHRALLAEHLWLTDHHTKCDVSEVVRMLQLQSSMAEKVAGMRIVQFASDPQLDALALPALMALFRVERHRGLSLKIADTLVRKRNFSMDLDMVAFLIRAWHGDGVPAAEIAMGSMLYGVEGFLMDNFLLGEQRTSALTKALLASFSPSLLPMDTRSVVDALTTISTDIAEPFAAFAATAALAAVRQSNAAGQQMVLETAQKGNDPVARALAIRVLGQQPRALLPLLAELKALAVAKDSDPGIRRAAFHALVNTQQSGLAVRMPEVIDLYFQYLREAPFAHFGDAVHGSDVAQAPSHFLAQFAHSLDEIRSESARQAAFSLISKTFGFGISEEFEPYWPQVIQLMLKALDKPRHGEVHYTIFWNMLHEVPMPKPAAAEFSNGLKERLQHIKYTKRTRGLIENWLQSHINK